MQRISSIHQFILEIQLLSEFHDLRDHSSEFCWTYFSNINISWTAITHVWTTTSSNLRNQTLRSLNFQSNLLRWQTQIKILFCWKLFPSKMIQYWQSTQFFLTTGSRITFFSNLFSQRFDKRINITNYIYSKDLKHLISKQHKSIESYIS